MTGNSCSTIPSSVPAAMELSTGLTEDAWTRTSTSRGPGVGVGTSTRTVGAVPSLFRVMAFISCLSLGVRGFGCMKSPRFPATSPAQYPAGSGVGVSVLLRQPQGFEGLRVIPEELLVDDLAPAHHKDVCDLHVHLRAIACGDAPGLPHGNSVAGIDEVADRFHYVGVPGFADVLPLAHDRVPAYERPRLRPPL